MNLSSNLRSELSARARQYAHSRGLAHFLSYGESPSVCFIPEDSGRPCHGNFLSESYHAIVSSADWRRRLGKVHTLGRRSFPEADRGRWMELDSCNSSDALLMNIFCYPRTLQNQKACALLGVETSATPCFGFRAKVPLANGLFDRTEVDMRLGNLLVEAKLTEADFQRADKSLVSRYRDFEELFEIERLPQSDSHFLAYQLLRNVLAAHALRCSFCVLLDGRRPNLIETWYAVMRCVKPVELRTALRVLTWQELARTLPRKLQAFLADKYGIAHCTRTPSFTEALAL